MHEDGKESKPKIQLGKKSALQIGTWYALPSGIHHRNKQVKLPLCLNATR
jgi:hypothetical protein